MIIIIVPDFIFDEKSYYRDTNPRNNPFFKIDDTFPETRAVVYLDQIKAHLITTLHLYLYDYKF